MSPQPEPASASGSSIRPFELFIALFLGVASPTTWAQDSLLWGSLKPGPHAVGYRLSYQFDHTRQFDPDFPPDPAQLAPHRPRPIPVFMWYPAQKIDAQPMEYRQYLDLASPDPQLATFIRRLAYNRRTVVCEESMGKPPEKLTPAEAAAYERLMATRTFATKEAPPADGRFPVVINHPGLGGTHEDNSALFEYLASHGYVILSSSYHSADAYSVRCGGHLHCSFRDMEFLHRYARGLEFADSARLGAMGHSYGAWAIFAWAAEPDSSLRAFVTLDSGLEYDTVETSGAEALQYQMKVNKTNIRAASLRVASAERQANFENLEPYLIFAPRYEATVSSMKHNDYLTHGAIRPALLPEKWPDAARRVSYDRMCRHILHFLDATLNQQAAARKSLERSMQGEGLDEGFKLRFKPPAPVPPTHWQMAQYIQKNGVDKSAELPRSYPGASLYGAAFVLLQEGDATTALAALTHTKCDSAQTLGFQAMLGQARTLSGDRDGALTAFRKAREILSREDPNTGLNPYWRIVIEQGLTELEPAGQPPEGR